MLSADAPPDAPASGDLLLTSDAILAALPVTPQLTAAAPTTEPPALPLLDDVASAAAAAAPLDEDEGAPAAMPPPPPRRNYPPVELDLSDSTAAASPALLPTTHSTVAVDSLPPLSQRQPSESDPFFFPLDGKDHAKKSTSLLQGKSSEPAEGGIIMLADIQQSKASKASFNTAWSEVAPPQPATMPADEESEEEESEEEDPPPRRPPPRPPQRNQHSRPPQRNQYSAPRQGQKPPQRNQYSDRRDGAGSRGGAPTHSGRRTDEERRAIESGGYSRGGMRRPGSSGELTTGLSDDDDGEAAGAAAERTSSGSPGAERTGGFGRYPVRGSGMLAEQIFGIGELPSPRSRKGGSSGAPSPRPSSPLAAASSGGGSSGGKLASKVATAPAAAKEAVTPPQPEKRTGPTDEAVRDAMRAQMAELKLTQYAVAQQVGVSQPVLCTYLGGKLLRASGKNAADVVRRKLIGWLKQRAPNALPEEEKEAEKKEEAAETKEEEEGPAEEKGSEEKKKEEDEKAEAPADADAAPAAAPDAAAAPAPASSSSSSPTIKPIDTAAAAAAKPEGGGEGGASSSSSSIASSSTTAPAPAPAGGASSSTSSVAEAEAAADGWQYHPRNEKRPGEGGEEGGASGKRPKRDGDEGHDNNELGCPPCEGIDGEEVARLLAARKDSSGRKLKLTPQHLYVAYVWYLNQREWKQREGGREFGAGEEEHFCFKCKDGGEMLLCDFDSPQCCKSYHTRCCNLKKAPEGVWECPRHRCVQCGVGPSATDAYGRPRPPEQRSDVRLWPCRTCPQTFCGDCLPDGVLHVANEIICGGCQLLFDSDLQQLQRDLARWDPNEFVAAADGGRGGGRGGGGSGRGGGRGASASRQSSKS